MGGAQGKQVAHLQVSLVEEVRPGNDEDLAPAGVRIGVNAPMIGFSAEAPRNRGQDQGFTRGFRWLVAEHLAMVEEGEQHRFIGQKEYSPG